MKTPKPSLLRRAILFHHGIALPKLGKACAIAVAFGLIGVTTASADQFVSNGDFSANASSFSAYPGQAGGSNAPSIEDFGATLSSEGAIGLNGPGTGSNREPFRPAGYYSTSNPNIPGGVDPSQFAWIQVSGTSSLPAGTDSDFLSQTLNLASDTTYTLSFEAAERAVGFGNDGVSGDVSILNSGVAVTNYTLSASPGDLSDGDFKYYTDTFTTGTLIGTTTLRLQNTSNLGTQTGDHTLDFADVSVTGPHTYAPEPTTWGLLGLGVGALALFRRRAMA